jgi:hypothetical protein
MYGFQGGSKPATIAANVKLARELKEGFAFVYRVSFPSLSKTIIDGWPVEMHSGEERLVQA